MEDKNSFEEIKERLTCKRENVWCQNNDHDITKFSEDYKIALNNGKTEREFAAYFGGGCHSPVGAYCEIKEGTATLYGSVLREGTMVKKSISCREDEIDGLAERLHGEYYGLERGHYYK